ncbi:MAG: hypothetical protein AAF743_14850 [Planctomycetota bacterium]
MNATTFEQRVEVPIAGLVCADKHDLDVTLALRVRLSDTAADRALFVERFGKEPDVGRFLIDTLRPTAEALTDVLNATDITADPSVLQEQLIDAAKTKLFAVGLQVLPPIECTATSHTLRRARLESVAAEEASRRSEAQAEQLRQAAALLDDVRTTDAPVGDLLANVAPAERGGMVQNLLRASAAEASAWTLHVVSGDQVVEVERGGTGELSAQRVEDSLGPLRSIVISTRGPTARGPGAEPAGRWPSAIGRVLGAQAGVWVDDTAFRFDTASSPQGFNGAIVGDGELFATHGEFGVVRWSLDRPNEADVIAAPPARCPHLLPDGRLLFASGREVIVDTSVVAELTGDVVAIVPVDRRLAAVGSNGSVVLIVANTLDVLETFSVGKQVKHAAALPWLGSARLVLATDAGVSVVGPDDGLSSDRAVAGGCKVVAATADTIAAVTGDRQRVVLLSTWDASAEPVALFVTATTRHRVGDLAFRI